MKYKNSQKGFSLIEVMVTLFIIVLISGIIFANFRKNDDNLALQRSADKLVQDIRIAQQMTLLGTPCPASVCGGSSPSIPPGYGIYLQNGVGEDSYILFADNYPPLQGDEFYTLGDDAVFETIPLEKGVFIKEIFSGGSAQSKISINFRPPDPRARIRYQSGDGEETAEIYLALNSDSSKTAVIAVNRSGLVYIDKTPGCNCGSWRWKVFDENCCGADSRHISCQLTRFCSHPGPSCPETMGIPQCKDKAECVPYVVDVCRT